MSDKSGFSKGKKHITVCGAGYTRSDISDGYLARAQKAEKIIGDKGPLLLTIDPADIDPSKITTGIIQVVNQHKPVVWVRKGDSGWYKCCEDGSWDNIAYDPQLCRGAWCDIYHNIAEVREWTQPEPEHEWVYAIYRHHAQPCFVVFKCHDKYLGWSYSVEGCIRHAKHNHTKPPHEKRCDYQGIPAFGVRLIHQDEWGKLKDVFADGWGAFRDGQYIKGTSVTKHKKPEDCIQLVLAMLFPVPSKTLADLETV